MHVFRVIRLPRGRVDYSGTAKRHKVMTDSVPEFEARYKCQNVWQRHWSHRQ